MNRSLLIRIAALICVLLALARPWGRRAQVAGGSIAGAVTGESGAAIPDVQVAIQDVSAGLARTATTNSNGIYSVPDLSAGKYEMTVSGSGFTTQVFTGITVTAGAERVLNVVMRAGNREQVTRIVAPP